MEKIASPQDLQAELRRLLAYSETERPSRSKLAAEISELAERVAGTLTVDLLKKLSKMSHNALLDIARRGSGKLTDRSGPGRISTQTASKLQKAGWVKIKKNSDGSQTAELTPAAKKVIDEYLDE